MLEIFKQEKLVYHQLLSVRILNLTLNIQAQRYISLSTASKGQNPTKSSAYFVKVNIGLINVTSSQILSLENHFSRIINYVSNV